MHGGSIASADPQSAWAIPSGPDDPRMRVALLFSSVPNVLDEGAAPIIAPIREFVPQKGDKFFGIHVC